MNDKQLIDAWKEREREQIKIIRTKDPADSSEVESVLNGAKIISTWTNESTWNGSRADNIIMKIQQQDGQIRYVNFGSDEGGDTNMTDEEREWNHFFMKLEEEDPPEIEDVPLYVLRYMRKFAYEEGADLAADAAKARELAIKIYMLAEKLDQLKNTYFRGGHEIHEEITRREREE